MELSDIDLRILAVAEDRLTGFHAHPFDEIAARCGVPADVVLERMRALLTGGAIRRIRQTLLTTALAEGALVAWKVPTELEESAYIWLCEHDPFTGHVVLRSCDTPTSPGADYRLWTTLKVPTGYGTVHEHCRTLAAHIGATDFVPLPVVGMFALGVGHVRRAKLQPGDKLAEPPRMQRPAHPVLTEREWQVLLTLKESLQLHELTRSPWVARAQALGMSHEQFCTIATALDERGAIGRFATFLDHTRNSGKHSGTGAAGLFHWTVPPGMEEQAGAECGRHLCMTHCYWRSGGAPFGGAQIMGVTHATTRDGVRAHKAAIDSHLAACGIPVLHTATFWSERAEIRPSEISPLAYQSWCEQYR
ncbi:MAG: Lrp/AsnC family transcriptional regulator [Akkermansia sp.]|nr:Lrp/AsnC family transcriptional regulator [Akkermansia sp.]